MMSDSTTDVNARIARSLRERGVRHTLRAVVRRLHALASRVLDRHFDAAFGTDTHGVIENNDLTDVSSPNLARGIRYQPTLAIPFRRVLKAARIPAAGGFVDLGCGKGRVLMLAALHGFPHVTGVDYSRALCTIAEKNLDALRARTGRRFTSSVVATDATTYAFADDDTVVYLFNPFDAAVLAAVVARLQHSLMRHPRTVWIVYHNPVWRAVIEHAGEFNHVHDYTTGGGVFAVYRSR